MTDLKVCSLYEYDIFVHELDLSKCQIWTRSQWTISSPQHLSHTFPPKTYRIPQKRYIFKTSKTFSFGVQDALITSWIRPLGHFILVVSMTWFIGVQNVLKFYENILRSLVYDLIMSSYCAQKLLSK